METINNNTIELKRKCPVCQLELPVSSFYISKKTGEAFGRCKACEKLKYKESKLKIVPEQINQNEPVNPEIDIPEFLKPKQEKEKVSTKSKKTNDFKDMEDNINSLVTGLFSVLSGSLGSHWEISNDESKKISKPLFKIVEDFKGIEVINENMKYISLISAIGIITVPRAIISYKLNKQRKEVENEQRIASKGINRQQVDSAKNEIFNRKNSNTTSIRDNGKESNDQNVNTSIKELQPAIC